MWDVGCGRIRIRISGCSVGKRMRPLASSQKLCQRSDEQTEILSTRIAFRGAGGLRGPVNGGVVGRPLVGPQKQRPLKVQAGVKQTKGNGNGDL